MVTLGTHLFSSCHSREPRNTASMGPALGLCVCVCVCVCVCARARTRRQASSAILWALPSRPHQRSQGWLGGRMGRRCSPN